MTTTAAPTVSGLAAAPAASAHAASAHAASAHADTGQGATGQGVADADRQPRGAAPAAGTAARPLWPLAGVLGGATAFAATVVGMPRDLSEEQWTAGVGVLDALDRGGYHLAFLLGLVSVMSLLVAAAGWRRWAARVAPDSLAAGSIGTGLQVTATVNVIGFALMGALAVYLPGGMDEGWQSREALFVNFAYLDFGILFGWWGAFLAALATAALAFGRQRLLPRWIGVVSVVFVLPPLAFATLTGLPGFPGVVLPVWLVIVSLGMVFSRRAAR